MLIQKLAPDDVVVMVDIVPNGSNGNSNYNVTNVHEHESPSDRNENSPGFDGKLPTVPTTTAATPTNNKQQNSGHTKNSNTNKNKGHIESGKLNQLV